MPAIFPAIMAVAPNSPSPLAKARMPPHAMPGSAAGNITFQKIRHSENPRVLAANIRFSSTCSSAPLAERYMSGKEITTAASTVAPQENAILTPKYSTKKAPIGRRIPNKYRRKNPATVGGRTRGRVKIPSSTILNFSFLSPATSLAAAKPMKKTMTLVSDAVLTDIHIGE